MEAVTPTAICRVNETVRLLERSERLTILWERRHQWKQCSRVAPIFRTTWFTPEADRRIEFRRDKQEQAVCSSSIRQRGCPISRATSIPIAIPTTKTVVNTPTASIPGGPLPPFQKFFNGQWNQPRLGGTSSSVLPNGPYWGDMNVAWDSATNQFISVAANAGIIITESSDGTNWVPSSLLESGPATANYEYTALTGTGADPSVLGDSFYEYFTDYQGWPSTIDRMTVSCGCH